MATDPSTIRVQVIYAAGPDDVWRAPLSVPPGCTVGQAIEASGFAQRFPGEAAAGYATGIYGQACPSTRVLADGDRVEIYRPLSFDPMESRRRRALHRQKRMSRT